MQLHVKPMHVPGMQGTEPVILGVARATSFLLPKCCHFKCREMNGLRCLPPHGDKGLCTPNASEDVRCCNFWCRKQSDVTNVRTDKPCTGVCSCMSTYGTKKSTGRHDSRGVGVLQESKLITLAVRTQGLHDRQDPGRGERGRRVESWSQLRV